MCLPCCVPAASLDQGKALPSLGRGTAPIVIICGIIRRTAVWAGAAGGGGGGSWAGVGMGLAPQPRDSVGLTRLLASTSRPSSGLNWPVVSCTSCPLGGPPRCSLCARLGPRRLLQALRPRGCPPRSPWRGLRAPGWRSSRLPWPRGALRRLLLLLLLLRRAALLLTLLGLGRLRKGLRGLHWEVHRCHLRRVPLPRALLRSWLHCHGGGGCRDPSGRRVLP